ncbi:MULTISPECIES: hypothetical protein [Gulbenkiania]|uniref:Uncharacterized protein n=1 Tax=Gulbenkiania indica TaxID=375574 RepID=A0A0K6GU96_9NEIS|nr:MULTISPECIES: hypothetical protein [Gulbenkiania]CUA82062.1 hypothetical protein Ga0061063_0917 [Gulbenkiania indica]
MNTAKRRAPPGVEKDLPVGVRFMPEEREEVIELSKRDGRTRGSFVRMIYLIGLAEWKRQQAQKQQ